ncbi:MAG: right-handed parallel beta-helix repeat-containing protein [Oscillospiraceae bacterium]
MKKKWIALLGVLVLLLSACAQKNAAVEPTAEETLPAETAEVLARVFQTEPVTVEGYALADGDNIPVRVTVQILDVLEGDRAYAHLREQDAEVQPPDEGFEYIVVTVKATYEDGELETLSLCENRGTMPGASVYFALSNAASDTVDMTASLKNSVYDLTLDRGESGTGAVAFLQEIGNYQPLYFVGFNQTAKFDIHPNRETVTVHTVDELLAAIGPSREIVLESGDYLLQDASDYGREQSSRYYFWEDSVDGYGLVITDVQNLVIRGSGRETTTLLAEPRLANVLNFRSCNSIALKDFTAGHTREPEPCSGGVLLLKDSWGITLTGLGLYGCGVTGIHAEWCGDLRVTDCDIYDCSSGGIELAQTNTVYIEGCMLHDLGTPEYTAAHIFVMDLCSNVRITNCQITDNTVLYLISSDPSDSTVVKDNVFRGNTVEKAAFRLTSSGLVLEGNTFEDNHLSRWTDSEGQMPVGEDSLKLIDEALEKPNYAPVQRGPAGERKEVSVHTVDELLAAIAPDTEIVLEEEQYDLSTAAGYGESGTDYFYWEEAFDGPNLVITGVDNLTIRSTDGDRNGHTITAIPRYAHVLTFERCTNIALSGFTAGHTREPGECVGGVLMIRDCDGVDVTGCGLFGCGILGVQAETSGNIRVLDCDIYECSAGGISLYQVNGVVVEGCAFRDLSGDSLMLDSCTDVMIDGETVNGSAYRRK